MKTNSPYLVLPSAKRKLRPYTKVLEAEGTESHFLCTTLLDSYPFRKVGMR
jgi:hypothetical protein